MRSVSADQARIFTRIGSMALAAASLAISMSAGYRYIGWPPVIIVGGAGTAAAFVLWSLTYLRRPIAPERVLPPFLLTVAALEVHMIEEYLTRFGPAMSRLFDISWSEGSFLMIFAFVGPILYTLTALGLFRRVPIARLSHVFHLHRPRCRGIHTLHLPGSFPRCTTYRSRVSSSPRGTREAYAGLGELSGTCHRALLLSGNVYRNPPDGPGRLRHS
jgi:hypothetical protein